MRSTIGTRVATWSIGVVGIVAATFLVGAPPERCPDVDADELRAASTEAVDWLVRNQQSDGRWLYEYHRTGGPVDTNYNIVRHAGVLASLYQAANAGIDDALDSAERGLAWAEEIVVPAGDGAAMSDVTVAKAGTSALLTSALVERRQLTGDDGYDDLLRDLGRFLAGQIEPSGAYLGSYDLERGTPVPDSYSRYYSGEAYWALGRLHNLFPDEGWGEAADRIGRYLATARDDAEDIFPPLADHWAGYGLAETSVFPDRAADQPLTDDELDYTRRQAGLFGAQVRFLAQRYGPWGALVRSPHDPRGGGFGVVGEGLTGLWLTAGADDRLDDLEGSIADRTVCNAGLMIDAQSDADEAARYAEPDKVRGAWFRDDITRMDDEQHALSALLRTIPIVEADQLAGGDASGEQAPSVWLWLLVLVAAWNPVRSALGVPRAGRPQGDPLRLAAVGGALGAVVVALFAAVGVWFLDVIDISDASLRIAAGVVAALGAIADLIRSAPPPDPALPGRRAALVPVAVPLSIRPALLVVGISAAADHGWWLSVVGVVVALAAFCAVTPVIDREAVSGRVARWVVRLTAILLAGAGILVVINGVLDI
jgi:small neutral amino acid transporter SnatA (MarC family)